MSAYEGAKQLRAERDFDAMVITALTGYGRAEDRLKTKEAGFDFPMTKPPNPAELADLIANPDEFGRSGSTP